MSFSSEKKEKGKKLPLISQRAELIHILGFTFYTTSSNFLHISIHLPTISMSVYYVLDARHNGEQDRSHVFWKPELKTSINLYFKYE